MASPDAFTPVSRIVSAVLVLAALSACALSESFDGFNAASWTVHGTVTGLGSEELVLHVNAMRLVVGDGPFTSAPTAGHAYEVSIESQPSGLRCVIAGGSGLVAGGDVTGVDVRCSEAPF